MNSIIYTYRCALDGIRTTLMTENLEELTKQVEELRRENQQLKEYLADFHITFKNKFTNKCICETVKDKLKTDLAVLDAKLENTKQTLEITLRDIEQAMKFYGNVDDSMQRELEDCIR